MISPWLNAGRDAWLEAWRPWVAGVVSDAGLGRVDGVESLREMPWSAVFRVICSEETLFFKAEGLGGRHEPGLVQDLAKRWGDRVPTVLAIDEARAWMLMTDAGRPLREVVPPDEQAGVLERVMDPYVEMQFALCAEADSLVARGVPDRRAAVLPDLLRQLLGGDMVDGAKLALESEEKSEMYALLPEFERCCEELAASAYSSSLDHGDLHASNVLVAGEGFRLCDWGDASVTHPFGSLMVTYRLGLSDLPAASRPSAAARLRDAYLTAWARRVPAAPLRRTFDLACWTAHVVRALDWVHMLQGADPEFVAEWYPHIAGALRGWRRHRALMLSGQDAAIRVFDERS